MAGRELPGWHGKLPSLGDFASRRLSPGFLAIWDTWLASGLHQLRQYQPDTWLDAYLASPTRRFLLMPGVLPGEFGQQAWAGVLMPSVDRVGRYFPFTIVLPLAAVPASSEQMQSLWSWLGRLDELAADAMHDDWTVDRLEAELAGLASPGLQVTATATGGPPMALGGLATLDLPAGQDIAQYLAIAAQALWQQRVQGLGYWYASAELKAPSLWVSRGLPANSAALLGGRIESA